MARAAGDRSRGRLEATCRLPMGAGVTGYSYPSGDIRASAVAFFLAHGGMGATAGLSALLPDAAQCTSEAGC